MKKLNAKDWIELIGKQKLHDIREAAYPPHKKPLWMIKLLDDQQLAEVYYRVFEMGESLEEIALLIRGKWGIQPKWKRHQFTRGLQVWKDRLDTDYSKAKTEVKDSPKEEKKIERVKSRAQEFFAKVDALGRLGAAIDVQTERLIMIHERELSIKTPLKMTDSIQANLTSMVQTYIMMSIKTGVLDGVPDELNVNFKAQADVVLEHGIKGDGNRIVRIAQKFLEQAAQHVVHMTMNEETGQYEKSVAPKSLKDRTMLPSEDD